jgi:hypothetical protein
MSQRSASTMMHLSNTTFAICPASGIPYTISFPNLGMDFTYKSPFATLSNVEALAKQSFPVLKALPKVTLAGLVLAYMRMTNLCEAHNIKSIDCNIALQVCTSHTLVATIKHISELPARKLASMPKLSFSSMLQQVDHSTPQDILKDWLKSCNAILHPTTPEDVEIEDLVVTTKTTKEKKPINISVEDKKILKSAVDRICKHPDCSAKFSTILHYICDGMTIITMDTNMRTKISDKLATFDSLTAAEIVINLLRKYSETLDDDFMDRAMDDSAIVKAKPTIAEILAARRLIPAVGTMS